MNLPSKDSAAPIHDRQGKVTGGVIVFHDVSEAKAMELEMSHLAQHDTLTNLPNRVLLMDRLGQAIEASIVMVPGWRCCFWISTDSSTSMTPWVMPLGTNCSNRLPSVC